MDGYIRVSQVRGREGDSFISPEVQRDQIETWARLRNVTIAAWHVDLDQTGGKLSRPGLDAAMARVRTRETGGIAVARMDRLSRAGVGDALRLIEELAEHDAQLAVVDLGVDPTTVFGEFALTIMLALARMERRRITENWRVARERAVARGVHIASATPTGYLREPDGRLTPHPDHAPAIRELFERRARGDSWRELARFLDDHQVEGPYGALNWRTRAVTHIIANRAYLGEARSGEFVNRHAHPPLIDRQTWEAAQQAPVVQATRTGEASLLAGLVRCAGCRHVMKPDRMTLRGGGRARIYRCRGEHASGRCPDRSAVLGSVIEPWIEQQFMEFVGVMRGEALADNEALRDAESAARDAEAELAAGRDDERILGALGADRFVEGLEKRAAAVDAAHRHLADMRAASAPGSIAAEDLGALWPELETQEKRKILRSAIDAVFLRSVGRSNVPIDDRALVLWHGEAPDDLPRRGLKRVGIRPFPWPAGDLPADTGVPVGEHAEEGALD